MLVKIYIFIVTLPASFPNPVTMDTNTNNKVPLISVITITYNAADVIRPTLDSLNAQSFRDFQHIVIDGASKDNTVDIVRELSPDSFVVSEPDKGLYDAMNKGLARATGRYLLFLNAGDSLHSADTLRHYAQAIHTNGHPDIVYGDTNIVDKNREFLRPRHLSAPKRLTFNSFANGMLVCHQAFMVRRELAPKYNTDYRFSADYEWTLRCLKASDPAKNINLNQVTIDYLSDGLTDKNHTASLKERFRIMSRYYGFLPTVLHHFRFLYRSLLS